MVTKNKNKKKVELKKMKKKKTFLLLFDVTLTWKSDTRSVPYTLMNLF